MTNNGRRARAAAMAGAALAAARRAPGLAALAVLMAGLPAYAASGAATSGTSTASSSSTTSSSTTSSSTTTSSTTSTTTSTTTTTTQPSPPPPAPAPAASGYWTANSNGAVYAFGGAPFYGSMAGRALNKPIVGFAGTPSGGGYWLVASDGGIFSFGNAAFYGSTGAIRLNKPIVGMASTPNGGGYWLVASDGGIFSFGNAPFHGSSAAHPSPAPAIGVVYTPAVDPYPPSSSGYDISFPQCGAAYPASPYSVAVVGVNNGTTFTANPCLGSEATWGSRAGLTLYMNLNSPYVSSPAQGNSGPAGPCSASDANCLAYNYGYNAAQYSLSAAGNAGAQAEMWWLDVEVAGSCGSGLWSCDTSANAQLIQGAITALTQAGKLVGVYSTSYQWNIIAGSYSPGVPLWVPTGTQSSNDSSSTAQSFCSQGHAFGGGKVWLAQFLADGGTYDGNWSCP
ncbi:MAG: glycoside hydrolase family 25 domain-containing protein [Acidimicrobiales bacterium]